MKSKSKVRESIVSHTRRLFALASLVSIVLLSFSQLALASGGDSSTVEMKKDVDGITVALVFPKGHAVTGINELAVRLHDAGDTPVDAAVKVTVQMDPEANMNKHGMENQTPKTVRLNASSSKGEYVAQVDFTDAGKWIVMTNFDVKGLEKEASFDVEVEGASRNWLVLGGFLGVLALVIAVAAIAKSRKAARVSEE